MTRSLLLLVLAGCSIAIPIIPDAETPSGLPVLLRANTPHNTVQIIVFIDVVYRSLLKEEPNIPKALIIVYPRGALWLTEGNKLRQLPGLAYLEVELVKITWDPNEGSEALAHELLHLAGWDHDRIEKSQIDEKATKAAREMLKQMNAKLRMRLKEM